MQGTTRSPWEAFFITLFVTAIVLTHPSEAFAQAGGGGGLFDAGTNFLQALADLLTTTWARLIGIIAVAATGLMWMTGRLAWGWAISVIGGVILIFGAATIVDGISASIA